MQISSLGDLAQSFSMQSRNASLKTDIQRLTLELASGKVSNVRDAIGGKSAYISDIERSLTKLDSYNLATREANQFAAGVQTALTRISDISTNFRNTLITFPNPTSSVTTNIIIEQAQDSFADAVSAINTSVSGRMLFSGTATNTPTLAPADTILADLSTAMAGAGNIDDMLAAAAAWFNNSSGYESSGYLGSASSLAPFALSDGDTVEFQIRGNDPELRTVLQSLAVFAVADDPALGLTSIQKSELLQKATPEALTAGNRIVDLQTKVGFSEARIESNIVRQSTQRSVLEMARNELLAINPYETATELEQVQFQLQSLYAITSRMSQLSLLNFL